MSNELILLAITALYTICNALRLLSYVPQIVAVAREDSGAHAISLISWSFWLLSHAATALYCATVVKDSLLATMMWGNTAGCLGVVALTMLKRHRHGWRRLRATGRSHPVGRPVLTESR